MLDEFKVLYEIDMIQHDSKGWLQDLKLLPQDYEIIYALIY